MNFRFSVSNKLIIGFGIITLGVLTNSILTFTTLDKSRQVSDEITKIYSPSVSYLNDLLSEINNSKMLIKNWVYIDKKSNTPDKIKLRELHSKDFPVLIEKINQISDKWDEGQRKTFNEIYTAINDTLFEKQKYVMNLLKNFDDYEDVMKVFEVGPMVEEGGDVMVTTDKITEKLALLTKEQEELVDGALTEMESSFNRFQNMVIFMGIILIIVAVAAAYLTIRSLVKPISYLKKIILLMGKGVLPQEKIKSRNDEIGDMSKAIDLLVEGLKNTSRFASEIGKGNFDENYRALSDKDVLGNSLLRMRSNLQELSKTNEINNWFQTSVMKVSDIMRGEKTGQELADQLLSILAELLDVQLGAIYIAESDDAFVLTGTYAYDVRKNNKARFKKGEGLVGQAIVEKRTILYTDPPKDYVYIQSGLGKIAPGNILVSPLVYQNEVVGVIELGTSREMEKLQLDLVKQVSESIAIAFNSIRTRGKMQDMLNTTRDQAEKLQVQQEELKNKNEDLQIQQEELKNNNEEMQVQQEELRIANEGLEKQTIALKKSEEDLKVQQEELQVTNEELEEKTKSLELQKKKISDKNLELEVARDNIQQKAKELEISSKYKSEFLANMSHELRTPLNSLLILSQDLADNKTKNLLDDQIESAEIIYKSGNDLLNLINEILDLSKIESGKMTLNLDDIKIQVIKENIIHQFQPITNKKGISLNVNIDNNVPESIVTDIQRLDQIIKNLMSNAIKFTEKDGITVHVHIPPPGADLSRSGLDADETLAISVIDTGIGIPKDKQLAIFEAFQQADGSTSRKYGGTGLGLSISRELAKLLRGEIMLRSEPGKGSTFTLYIPTDLKKTGHEAGEEEEEKDFIATQKPVKRKVPKPPGIIPQPSQTAPPPQEVGSIDDDRHNIKKNDKVILIIEDDPEFAKILCKQGHGKGFKCIASPTGENGLKLAGQYTPDAIILDIKLPGIDGLSVLDKLKENQGTRHIPVHMMSGIEETIDVYKKGAIGYLTKPVKTDDIMKAFTKIEGFIDRKMKNLLIVEDDEAMRKSIKVVIGEVDVNISEVKSGQEAFDTLKDNSFDCMVLDLGLPDMTGFDLLKKLEADQHIEIPPIIVYTGKDLTKEENDELQQYTNSIIIKGVKSAERLLDDTALFLHRVVDDLPDEKQKIIANLHDKEKLFRNKNILVVDDDMRNVFALSKVLRGKGMNVTKAVNGQMALDALKKNPGADLVLMDIMMPVMDGYDAMKAIRKQPKFNKLPIIALTAKAMKEDRNKCIEAGANDYMAKPVNVEKLLSLMRVWLYNK